MTRMSEERLEEIRRTIIFKDGRDLLAEVDALCADLSAFRRAALTDGAGGTEAEVTPEALEAELRLLRARPGQCEDVLEVAGDRIQCEFFRGHAGGHTGDAFDWSPVSEGGPRPDVKAADAAVARIVSKPLCVCGHEARIHLHHPLIVMDTRLACLGHDCPCPKFEAAP